MKIGMRTPSPKRSIKARTTGKVNRMTKSSVNPLYGKKGMGYINNPQKAMYNKVYNKTTVGVRQVFDNSSSVDKCSFDTQNALLRVKQLHESAKIINSTTNVSTFFSRFDFALQICDELKEYEYTGCLKTISPSQQKYELMKQLPSVINHLIVRCYEKEFEKAQLLKTDKGKHNRMVRFFNDISSELNQYGAKYITETNVSKLNELALSSCVSEEEIYTKLNPTTLVLPQVESTTPLEPLPENVEQKNNSKKICPNCNGIFINNTICPNCSCQLNDISDEQSYDTPQTDYSKAAGCAAVIYMCMKMAIVIIVGVFTFIMEFYLISFFAFLIVAIACYLAYKMASS